MMIYINKLIVASVVMINTTSIPLQVTRDKWIRVGFINTKDPKIVNQVIIKIWPGYELKNFHYDGGRWFQHDDVAFEWDKPEVDDTIFYELRHWLT